MSKVHEVKTRLDFPWLEWERMKPILFNTEMVRAIKEDRKTATRRVVKEQPKGQLVPLPDESGWPGYFGEADTPRVMKPPYFVGDILYVRETWCDPSGTGYPILYRADMPMHWDAEDTETGVSVDLKAEDYTWRQSIHMPKDYARLFLRVTDVRVERLQDITEEQAVREGIYQLPNDGQFNSACWTYLADPFADDPFGKVWSADEGARGCFRWLWGSTIKPADRGLYGWLANPWVWVIEFERISKEE